MLHLLKMDKEKALYGKTGGGSAYHWRKCHGGTALRTECNRKSRLFSGKNEAAHFQKWYCGRRKSIRKRLFVCGNANGNRACFPKRRISVPGGKRRKVCEDVDFEDLKLYSFGEEIKPYEYYLDDGETKDFTIESHIRMLSC